MKITYDSAKNALNIQQRGLSFDRVAEFSFETALITIDTRRDYKAIRNKAHGKLKGRVHGLIFTETTDGIRVISFRKANKREVLLYEKNISINS